MSGYKIGPYKGGRLLGSERDFGWSVSRDGSCGYWGDDEWRATEVPGWTLTRNWYEHIVFNARVWATRQRGRLSATLDVRWNHDNRRREIGKRRGFKSLRAARAWLDEQVARFVGDRGYGWDELRWLWKDDYRAENTTHVYRREADGSWAPFCSVFHRLDSLSGVLGGHCSYFGSAFGGVRPGRYVAINAAGAVTTFDGGAGSYCMGGFNPTREYAREADRWTGVERLARWTRHTPMATDAVTALAECAA